MVKNCLAFVGLMSLILVVFLVVFVLTAYPDQVSKLAGLINVPAIVQTAGPVHIQVSGDSNSVTGKKNLVETLPTMPAWESPVPVPTDTPLPTDTPVPTPTSTPDPVVYRTEVIIRVKRFASALDNFTAANDKLQNNPALIEDSTWQRETETTLDDFVASAVSMGAITSVPDQYQDIQALLVKVGPESQKLNENYLTGLQTHDAQYFQAVNDNRNTIIDDMALAVAAMQAAGWQP